MGPWKCAGMYPGMCPGGWFNGRMAYRLLRQSKMSFASGSNREAGGQMPGFDLLDQRTERQRPMSRAGVQEGATGVGWPARNGLVATKRVEYGSRQRGNDAPGQHRR